MTISEDTRRRLRKKQFADRGSRLCDAARNRWFDDYVALVVERDLLDITRVRQREALPRLLAQLAAQTGGVLSIASAARRARLEASTAENYTKLLEAAFLIHRLPAWGRTLRSRVTATPKLHVVDSGLAARLLRLTPDRLERRDAAALTELGHLVETFAVNELLKQATWSAAPVSAGHFRTKDGAEVDVVLERDDGALVGVEIKAASAARPATRPGFGGFASWPATRSSAGSSSTSASGPTRWAKRSGRYR